MRGTDMEAIFIHASEESRSVRRSRLTTMEAWSSERERTRATLALHPWPPHIRRIPAYATSADPDGRGTPARGRSWPIRRTARPFATRISRRSVWLATADARTHRRGVPGVRRRTCTTMAAATSLVTMAAYALDGLATDALGLIDVVGHDCGGMVRWRLTAQVHERVHRVVVLPPHLPPCRTSSR